jgi:hypothetical protein
MDTCCINCMNCKVIPRNRMGIPRSLIPLFCKSVKCAASVFRGTLPIHHPFITLPRNCPQFDNADEEPEGEKVGI